METEEKNLYEKDWEKELENKGFEDLAKILANKDDYAPEFIKMVQQRIHTHSDYSDEKVNAIIEMATEERRHNEELAEQRMSGWLMFFMFGLVLGSLTFFYRTFSTASPEYYEYNIPLMWSDITIMLGIVVLAGYVFIALYKRWNNAVSLVYTYLGISVFVNLLTLIQYGSEVGFRALLAIVIAFAWGLYFAKSERIKARFPEEERCFHKRDKYFLAAIIAIPIILFVWGSYSTPSSPAMSVADGMDINEINQTSLVIDEKKLKDGEITDGFTIVKLPNGIKHEVVDLEEDQKMIVLSDEKGDLFYEIRIISGFTGSFNKADFENYWSQNRDSTMLCYTHELSIDNISDIAAGKCYRKVEKYDSELPAFWDFSAIYNYKMHKYCVLSAWYNDKTKVPIDEIINSIKLEQ